MVRKEDMLVMRDIEQYYSTSIDELPVDFSDAL
jgi:hypothetical protein